MLPEPSSLFFSKRRLQPYLLKKLVFFSLSSLSSLSLSLSEIRCLLTNPSSSQATYTTAYLLFLHSARSPPPPHLFPPKAKTPKNEKQKENDLLLSQPPSKISPPPTQPPNRPPPFNNHRISLFPSQIGGLIHRHTIPTPCKPPSSPPPPHTPPRSQDLYLCLLSAERWCFWVQVVIFYFFLHPIWFNGFNEMVGL